MQIYLAGAWVDRVRLRSVMDQIEELGHNITHDWTSYESQWQNEVEPRNVKRQQDCARHDINGVLSADLYIAVMDINDYPYRGTNTELGCALGLGTLYRKTCGAEGRNIDVWIVADGIPGEVSYDELPAPVRGIFTSIADRYFTSVPEMLEFLKTQ